ncbi:MAG: tail fiber domain-containing protein [Candidatus Zambryskibacteria bacterium]|nr:tail fiber domain-containing protein [Candidatus Zambryskibacteria bacterium]
MTIPIFSNGKEYISASRASEKIGYASDYIGQLSRSGKIPSKLIGRTWYVDFEALVEHKKVRQLGKPRKGNFSYIPVERSGLPQLSKKVPIVSPVLTRKLVREFSVASFALLAILTGAFTVLELSSPPVARSIEQNVEAGSESISQLAGVSLSSFAGIISDSFSFLKTFFNKDEPQLAVLPAYKDDEPRAISSPSPGNWDWFKADLKSELYSYVDQRLATDDRPPTVYLSGPSDPADIVYNYTYNPTILREEILLADTHPAVRIQSDRDASRVSNSITNILNGGDFTDSTLTGASISNSTGAFSTLSGSNLTFTIATGTSATTTNFFSTTASSTSLFFTSASGGALTVSGNATVSGSLTVGGDTVTVGQLLSTRVPTLAHVFSPSWPSGTSNASDATIYINPASAAPDTNIFAAAVGGAVKFLVDAEGDVYANNLVLAGSTSQGATTIAGSMTVQDNATLGDASSDTITANAQFLALASTTLQNFTFTNATGTSATTTSFFSTTASSTNLYASNLFSNTANLTESTNLFYTDARVNSYIHASTTIPKLYTGNTFSGNNVFSSLITGSISGNAGTVTNGVYTTTFNGLFDNRLSATTTLPNLTTLLGLTDVIATRSTTTNATTTNFFSTTASSTNLFTTTGNIGTLTLGSGTLGNLLLTGSTTLQNFTFVNATGTSATTTNFFSATASSTNLFSSLLSVGGTALNVTAGGIVGIGITNPTSKLQVVGDLRIESSAGGNGYIMYRNGTSGELEFQGNQSGYTGYHFKNSDGASRVMISSTTAGAPNGGIVGIATTNPRNALDVNGAVAVGTYAGVSAAPSNGLIVSGNVGIGTTNPSEKLEVSGNLLVTGNSTTTNATTTNFFSATASSTNLFSSLLSVGGTQGLNVIAGGNVGIGTTTPSAWLTLASGSGGTIFSEGIKINRGTVNAQYSLINQNGGELNILSIVEGGGASGAINFQRHNAGSGSPSSSMYISSTGNVGIGTTGPGYLLHVVGSSATALAAAAIQNSSAAAAATVQLNGDLGITGSAVTNVAGSVLFGKELEWTTTDATRDGYLAFSTLLNSASGERMRITSAGNVGIGTTNPIARLDLGGGYGSSGAKLLWYNDNSSGELAGTKGGIYLDRFSLSNNTTMVFATAAAAPGSLIFASKDTGGTTLVARMTVLGESGNVGIGTTGPEVQLQIGSNDSVVKAIEVRYSSVPTFWTNSYDGGNALATLSVNGRDISSGSSSWATRSNASFGVAGIQMGTASDKSSYVQFLTTSTDTATPSARMTIGSTGNVGIGVDPGNGSNKVLIKSAGATSATYGIGIINSNSVDEFYIRSDGYGFTNQAAWNYASDRRLKENIQYLDGTGALTIIRQLKPATFDYIVGEKNNIGFIAQDVQEIIPSAVTINEKSGMLSLKTEFIMPYLVNAIQELDLKIEGPEGDFSLSSLFADIWDAVVAKLADAANGIGEMIAGTFRAKDKLCINETCVTEEQLKALLSGSGTSSNTDSSSSATPNQEPSSGTGQTDSSTDSTSTTTESATTTATTTTSATTTEPAPTETTTTTEPPPAESSPPPEEPAPDSTSSTSSEQEASPQATETTVETSP